MARKVTVIPANPTSGSKAAGGGKKTRVAAYCRVSTDHEEQEGSFKNQVDYYTKLIEKTPGWELAGIFADDGISGTGTITPAIKYCHFRWCPHPVPDTEPAWGDRNMI